MALDIPRAQRLRSMTIAAVPEGAIDGNHAPGLTSAYESLRGEISSWLEGDLRQEFDDFFPALDVVEPPSGHPREIYMFAEKKKSTAQGAATKLRLMAGWLGGLIDQYEDDPGS
jgi:hypothetical protein